MNRINKIIKYTRRHIPEILSIIGSIGVVGTAYLSAKGGADASEDKFIDRIKHYIPAIGAGIVTIGCVIGSIQLSRRQNAALISACALASRHLDDYKHAVKDLFGEEGAKQVEEKICVEKTKDIDIWATGLVDYASLDFDDPDELIHLFCDSFSGRYFESTINKVLQAQYHLNRSFMIGGEVSLNDYYEFLGLSSTDRGEELGWSVCSGLEWIDFDNFRSTIEDGTECFVIAMVFEPEPLDAFH